jgi:hypothetical protein
MGDLSNRFLGAYNRLDDALRERIRSDSDVPFSTVVERAEANRIICRRDAAMLKKLGRLRNAIVHDERYPSQSVAEPHEATVTAIEGLHAAIVGPKSIHSIATKNPRVFEPGESLRSALQEMRRGDFSQVVVRSERGLQLLTADGIASWIESKHDEEIIDLTAATIADALGHERLGRYRVVSRTMPLSQVIAAFEEAAAWTDDRLFALLVTNSGIHMETCIGIVTPSDAFGAA